MLGLCAIEAAVRSAASCRTAAASATASLLLLGVEYPEAIGASAWLDLEVDLQQHPHAVSAMATYELCCRSNSLPLEASK